MTILKGIKQQALFGLILGLILSVCIHAKPIDIPDLRSRVMDLTQTLGSEQQSELESKLSSLEQAKGSQLVVLIVATTGEETIEQYSIRVVDAWQLGRKGVDDGVLLLIAKDDRTVRIEVGRGLEGALPDVIASRIIRDTIVPAFKAGDFVGGVNAGVNQISAVIQGEALPETKVQSASQSDSQLPFILLIPLLALGGILRRVFGFLISFASTSIIAGLGLLYFGMSVPFAIALGAFIGLIVSTKSSGISSGSGSIGGGFGGGGGFSGGGGGFGGGGASGRW
ncbi:TPM domain-containing protein [Chitinibacter sp. SCUT-21]|uniref:TPM domain-containing protein n=1 Tax=Chitinibacter sp. SCUT-21 TaxID=2970891 RepID=UPI0035A5D54A